MLSEFAAKQGAGGIQVVGLAVDKPEAVLRFCSVNLCNFQLPWRCKGIRPITGSG